MSNFSKIQITKRIFYNVRCFECFLSLKPWRTETKIKCYEANQSRTFFSFLLKLTPNESPFGPGACPQHHALVPPTSQNYYVNSTKVESSLNFVMYHTFLATTVLVIDRLSYTKKYEKRAKKLKTFPETKNQWNLTKKNLLPQTHTLKKRTPLQQSKYIKKLPHLPLLLSSLNIPIPNLLNYTKKSLLLMCESCISLILMKMMMPKCKNFEKLV